jgi:hypothetical protein
MPATEVFDGSAPFDPYDGTSVRVGTREVRKGLAHHYGAKRACGTTSASDCRLVLCAEFILPEIAQPERRTRNSRCADEH